jgi:hypothetical protein
MKVDLALRSVEAALKAVFWRHENLPEWPSQSNSMYKFLYKHNLETLLTRCGLLTRLKKNRDLWASWQTLVNASIRVHRYSAQVPTDSEANEIAKSARHPDLGIVPWLKKHYETIS